MGVGNFDCFLDFFIIFAVFLRRVNSRLATRAYTLLDVYHGMYE